MEENAPKTIVREEASEVQDQNFTYGEKDVAPETESEFAQRLQGQFASDQPTESSTPEQDEVSNWNNTVASPLTLRFTIHWKDGLLLQWVDK